MIRLLSIHLVTCLIATWIVDYAAGRQEAQSFAIGSALIWLNLILLGIVWHQILKKKLIALAMLVIVFKYAILGTIIYFIVKLPWLKPLFFAGGLSTLLVASLIYAVSLRKDENGIQSDITDSWSG